MLHKGAYPLTPLKLMPRPVQHHRHAKVQLKFCQMMRQPISQPVQHMDEPINSMTTLQCSSHVLATDETTEHVSLPISLKQANHQMRIYHFWKQLLLKNMMTSLIRQIQHNQVLRLYVTVCDISHAV